MRAPKVLVVAGSPRRNGNSDQLLDVFVEAAETGGAEVTRIVASELAIRPCRGCNACSSTGRCIQRDGMRAVYRLLDDADALCIGSPVYFATVPAVLKTLYDRCQPYWARRYVLKQPIERRRPGAFLVVRSGGDPHGFAGAEATTLSVFAVLGIDLRGLVRVEGVEAPRDVRDHPEALRRAAAAGAGIASEAASAASPL